MAIITDGELISLCKNSLIQLPNYTNQSLSALQVLEATGCRPAEAVDLSRWSLNADQTFTLQPLKGNNPRIIPAVDLPQLFVDYFTGGSQEYKFVTLSRTAYYYAKVWPTTQIFKGRKSADLYVYRYAFVKLKFIEGASIQAITDLMGWKTQAMAERYVNAILFTAPR